MIFFIFIFGLIIGSFLNCIIWRLHEKKSPFRGRSHCPNCQHLLAWYDNIPLLSFFVLKGKCRYCNKHISWQYPLVELATGLLFVLAYLHLFPYDQLLITKNFINDELLIILLRNWFFMAVLIIIFVYDLKYKLILDQVTLPAMAGALIFNLLDSLKSQVLSLELKNLFLSAIIGGGFFLIQYLVSKGKWIGGGDIRLGVLMGLVLSWPYILIAIFLAYIIGSLTSLILIASKIKTLKSKIAFGTFLSVATVMTLFWGKEIISWYFSLF